MSHSMLATARAAIREAADRLGINEAKINALLEAEAEYVFEIEVEGKHFPAYRVQHNSKFGPYKGGVRFHPSVTLEDVRALATLMTLKTAAIGLPLGGGKGGIAVDPRSLTPQQIEELSRCYVRELAPHIGSDKDIPAPDVNTNAQIMDWMLDELEKVHGAADTGAFTGKSLKKGGSIGRDAATGQGGVITLVEYLKHRGLAGVPLTVAVQGFGNVGYHFAKILREYPELRLIALSNSKHTWLKPDGIDVSRPSATADAIPRPEDLADLKGVSLLPAEEIISVKADIVVLAALEDAITEVNMHLVKADALVELANGPISKNAAVYLRDKGKTIVPDILANAGGVIVSYLEWVQNRTHQNYSEQEVAQKMSDILIPALHTVFERAHEHRISHKQAAIELAVERLVV